MLANTVQPQVVTVTASDALTELEHGNRTVRVSAAAGLTLTLPAATGTGNTYTIFIATTVTSNSVVIQAASASDTMSGGAIVMADGGDTLVGFETTSTSDTITLNGSTTGGKLGDQIILQDVASGKFRVLAILSGTGTEATPFSAAVS